MDDPAACLKRLDSRGHIWQTPEPKGWRMCSVRGLRAPLLDEGLGDRLALSAWLGEDVSGLGYVDVRKFDLLPYGTDRQELAGAAAHTWQRCGCEARLFSTASRCEQNLVER